MRKIRQSFSARLVLITLIIVLQTEVSICDGDNRYRLSRDVFPESYDIKIRPYFTAENGRNPFTFDGEVNITLRAVQRQVRIITLHKSNLEIARAALYRTDTQRLVQNFAREVLNFEKETDKLSIYLSEPLVANASYTLYFNYGGRIRNQTAGIFRADYLDAQGQAKWMVLTQAQRIETRTIVPCWDEPAFKAKFRLSISRPKGYISAFNTRLADSKIDDFDPTRYVDTYAWTPAMSSYLLAFMIADYVKRGDGEIVVLSRPEFYNYTEFTYDVAQRTLEAYNNYTKIPYKELGNDILQMASSPKFLYNGMENWGLILYRDPVLVQEPGYSDGWRHKQYTISVLVHETAHMWFGNSVTFAWWSYFWLNEAFARYYQYYLAHQLYPEYQLDLQFVVNQVHSILDTDAQSTTIPLSTKEDLVRTPTEIAHMFSSIAYAKGASVIRMFRNLMGHDHFDQAIHEYLTEFHLKNTVPNDLFKHLKRHWPADQQVNLDYFFYDWTEQVGFPVLIVEVDKNRQEVTVKQKRFLLPSAEGSNSGLKYTVPITYTTDLEKNFEDLSPKAYFNATKDRFTFRTPEPFNWILFNIQQSNYHRVFYDTETLNRIFEALADPLQSGIHVINRAHLVDDLFNFARTDMMEYVEVFRFLEYLSNETEYLPWQATFTGLARISRQLTMPQQRSFGKFITRITSKAFQELGFERANDTVLDVYNRNNMVYWTCKYGNTECNEKARALLLEANIANQSITSDFRETVYCSAIRFGDFKYYNIVDQWYRKESRMGEKELLLRSLGCTSHFVRYHFDRIFTDEIPQDLKGVALKSLYAENPENVTPVLSWIIKTYYKLAEKLGGFSVLAEVLGDLSKYISTERDQEAFEEFIEDHNKEFGESIVLLDKATKSLKHNIEWAEDRLEELSSYLDSRSTATLNNFSVILTVFSIGILKFLI